MTPEQLFLDHLEVIEQAVRFVAKRHSLPADEAEELSSVVKLKLLEDDYAVLRKFRGQSTLRTYLATVVQNCFLDRRVASWGRWRPCAESRRLGPAGVLLDRLITRDGLGTAAALDCVRSSFPECEIQLLEACAERLVPRTTRRFVEEERLAQVPSSDTASALLDAEIAASEAVRTDAALHAALGTLTPDDGVILKLRFVQGLRTVEIARLTGLDQKRLYRQMEHVMRVLRRELESRGITSETIRALTSGEAVLLGPVMQRGGNEESVGRYPA